jgi:Tfp pilus assembly protein PilF
MTMARKWLLLIALGGLVPQAGCHSLPGAPNPAGTVSVGPQAPQENAPPPKELNPADTAKVCFATAEELEKGDKLPEAITLYEKCRQQDPKMTAATRRLAVLYDRIGQFDQARTEYERAIKQNPKDPDLYNDLGYGYYCRGEWAEAEKVLRKALELNPKHERALINIGMALGQQERYPEALAYFERAVSPGRAKCNLAFVLATQGKKAEARRAYEEALAQEPGLQLARNALARLDRPDSAPTPPRKEAPKAPPVHTTTSAPVIPPPTPSPAAVSGSTAGQPPSQEASPFVERIVDQPPAPGSAWK